MERERVRRLLRAVRAGTMAIERAIDTLSVDPLETLDHATVDTQRALRRGFPEVIYGPGKTPEQIIAISRALRRAGQTVLVTRVDVEVFERVARVFPSAEDHRVARAVVIRSGPRGVLKPGVTLVTAGTADLAVGEEAALAAELLGSAVVRVHDVGVAGIHRLTAHLRTLVRSRVIIVVAGMEGALPSVVSGLTACPVVAVPTSTGYGTGAGGFAALFTMLNSCSAGVSVVNIDNGFGAGCVAGLINRLGPGKAGKSKKTKSN